MFLIIQFSLDLEGHPQNKYTVGILRSDKAFTTQEDASVVIGAFFVSNEASMCNIWDPGDALQSRIANTSLFSK
jgi:hypothetical protein